MLNGVKRRSKLVIVSFALIFVGFFLLAFLWPATYTSNGVILIEQQELPQELVRSTITSYADQRIQSLSQRVMTTENLNKLINLEKLKSFMYKQSQMNPIFYYTLRRIAIHINLISTYKDKNEIIECRFENDI